MKPLPVFSTVKPITPIPAPVPPFVPFPPGTIRGPYYPQPFPATGNRFMVQGHNGWIPVYQHRHETLEQTRTRAEDVAADVKKGFPRP